MPCADAASRKYEWENSVSRFCQVKNRFVEPHIDEASNIFPKHPTGPQLGNNSAHLRPQVAFILKPFPPACGGEGLAGESAGDDGNGFKSCFLKKRLLRECRDIPEPGDFRPVLFQDGIGIVRPFALADGCKPGSLRRQVQPANAGKQAHMGQLIHPSPRRDHPGHRSHPGYPYPPNPQNSPRHRNRPPHIPGPGLLHAPGSGAYCGLPAPKHHGR